MLEFSTRLGHCGLQNADAWAPADQRRSCTFHSNTAVLTGAVLSQVQNGEEKVIAYASRTNNKAERNYCAIRKEHLAAVYSLRQFKQYLLGAIFFIRTDHAALTWL